MVCFEMIFDTDLIFSVSIRKGDKCKLIYTQYQHISS